MAPVRYGVADMRGLEGKLMAAVRLGLAGNSAVGLYSSYIQYPYIITVNLTKRNPNSPAAPANEIVPLFTDLSTGL